MAICTSSVAWSLFYQYDHSFINIIILLSILSFFYQYDHYFINIIILLSILSFFYQYYHSFIHIIILLSVLSLFYPYYHYFIIIIYNRQQVNIDIGTKILKQKCFVHKTNFFNTYSNFPPAIEFQISSSIRISYSRPLFRIISLKMCMRPWICR